MGKDHYVRERQCASGILRSATACYSQVQQLSYLRLKSLPNPLCTRHRRHGARIDLKIVALTFMRAGCLPA
jgi:hypothetical protein